MKKKKFVIFALTALSATMLSTAIACSADTQPEDHNHNWAMKSNSGKHWYECSCGEKKGEADHTDVNADGKCDACQYVLEGDKTEYTVTFNVKGHGTAPQAQNVEEGSKVNKPADPTDVNYNFKGWYTDEDCSTPFDFKSAISGNITLYAKWQVKIPDAPVTVTVTFDVKGHGTAPASQEVTEGGKVTQPADLTDDHYDFMGWCSDEDCSTPFDFENDTVSTATTIYAKWEAKTFTVTFFDVENIGDMPEAISVKYGETATEPETAPTAEHYEFKGWYSDKACTQEFDFETTIDKDTKIYAKWEFVASEDTVKVSFDLGEVDGKANAPKPQIITKDAVATEPATNPTATHHDFDGWYEDEACTTAFDFSAPVTANTTVYAHWVGKMYDVTFDLNGKDSVAPDAQTVRYNETATEPTDPSVSGFKFLGWYKEAECKNAFDFNTKISGNTVIYAKWSGPLGSQDNPIQLIYGEDNLSKNHESDVLYYVFSGSGTRLSLNVSGIMAPNCSFTTSLDGYKTVYGKGGASSFNFDLGNGQEITVKLDRSGVSKTADIGLKVTEVTDEDLPADGWVSGTFYSVNRSYSIEFSRDFGSGTNKYLKYNGVNCAYTYIGGVTDTATFTYENIKYTLTQEIGGYKIAFSKKYVGDLEIELNSVHKTDISKFAGIYQSNTGLYGNTKIVIYESGNGYFEGWQKNYWTYGEDAFYDEDSCRLTMRVNYANYGITLITDANGNATAVNFFDPNDDYCQVVTYVRKGDAGKEIPEKLPLSDGLELVGETLGINCQYGSQSWADGYIITITDFDKDPDIYTVKHDDVTYTLEIEGTGDDTVVKIYNENHDTLIDTLSKKVAQALDLVTDGSEMNFTSADTFGDYKSVFFKITQSGTYTFDVSDPWITLYTNIVDFNVTGMNGHYFSQYVAGTGFIVQPVTIELNANTVIAFSTSEAGDLPEFWIKATVEEGEDPGPNPGPKPSTNGSGTQEDPYVIEGEGTLVANVTADWGSNYAYVKFTATEAGDYLIKLPVSNGDPSSEVVWTVNGVSYGYDEGTWAYTWAGQGCNLAAYKEHSGLSITLAAGESVDIVLKQTAWGGTNITLEVIKV